jgi:hypothetical protein
MSNWKQIWHFAVSEGVPRRSLYVALLVGTILNLINQGDSILASASIDWVKLGLTYCVPFCVSTYGAVSYRIQATRSLSGPARSLPSS